MPNMQKRLAALMEEQDQIEELCVRALKICLEKMPPEGIGISPTLEWYFDKWWLEFGIINIRAVQPAPYGDDAHFTYQFPVSLLDRPGVLRGYMEAAAEEREREKKNAAAEADQAEIERLEGRLRVLRGEVKDAV